ncbi:hypothetical protein Glove_352g31 [Diversispora epigaea]|uniref:TLDc domain-containing protein n=1 Tax=Diversispora epigaea TaxID=1348612 RepID=A0A397HJE3_9GLOM|nr:hypothetical protein Glove_352g31 [Diversispora epigaea]
MKNPVKSYFCKELKNIIPNENNIKTITKPNISDEIFDIILKECRTKSSIFSENNFNDFVAKYPNLIFDAEDFNSLQESALVSLLKGDDLQLEEVIIWEYIIKWGISQNPTLPEDLKEWNNENFTTLKITLQQCLPLIRYFHIPGTDVWSKVKPYKKILDKQLWEDLKQNFMAPDKPLKSIILPPRTILMPTATFSVIITYEHVAEISSWIDCKSSPYSLTNIPYEFQLILRGSTNGFAPQTFWDTCHGHASTVVIMKVKETEEILGGYNPLAWNSNAADTGSGGRWEKTDDSFTFSLKNGNKQNSILSKVKNRDSAIWNANETSQMIYGPWFENGFGMSSYSSDFTVDNYSVCSTNYDYEKPIRNTTENNFSIVNYEVFKVVKKTS